MSERELIDGAFYRVRDEDGWNVAWFMGAERKYPWRVVGSENALEAESFAEIGPCIGKEPRELGPACPLGGERSFTRDDDAGGYVETIHDRDGHPPRPGYRRG